MPGASDYTAESFLNWETGFAAMPALGSRWLALYTTLPGDDGTGGTEVSGGSYARVQVAGAATTNGATASGNATLHFSSTPSWIVPGMSVQDLTAPSVIPAATTVVSVTGTTVVMSATATGSGVGSGDSIQFSAFPTASGSSGTEPDTTPANVSNAAAIAFPTATADWTTVVGFGVLDASSSGNYLYGDYLGQYSWQPCTISSASPGVVTSTANGYGNGDQVAFTEKYGGSLPTTGGSFAGLKTVASATTDTFTAGVNTTSTGDGSVRKVVPQSVPSGVTVTFNTSGLTLTVA